MSAGQRAVDEKQLDPWTGTSEEIEHECKIFDGIAQGLWPNILQLFTWKDYPQGRPKPFGSSVLVRNGARTYIFSAAHVLAEFKNSVIWARYKGDDVLPLPAAVGRLTGQPDMGDHEHDKTDAGVLVLPPNSPELSVRAMNLSEIRDSENDRASENCDAERFMLLGYPANRTEVDSPKKAVRSEQWPLVYTEVEEKVYAKAGYDPRIHLLLKWRNQWKSTKGLLRRARNLAGASGGAIWCFNPKEPSNPPQLVATFTELGKMPGGKVLVGTRIEEHLGMVSKLERERDESAK